MSKTKTIKNAIILAGGKGTRLSEQTVDIPKPLVEVGGVPIIVHVVRHLASQGIENIVIAGGYKVDLIKEYFISNRNKYQGNLIFRDGEVVCTGGPLPQGLKSLIIADTGQSTGTALRIARAYEEFTEPGPFFVAYGDNVSDVDLSQVEAEWEKGDRIMALTAVRYQERFGILHIDGDKSVTKFAEKSMSQNEFINGGFIACSPEVAEMISEDADDFSKDIMPVIQAQGRLGAHVHEGFWAAMDTQRDWVELNALYDKHPELFSK